MSGTEINCGRCGKNYSGFACPFCTVTGMDLEALINTEGAAECVSANGQSPVELIDLVSGNSHPVVGELCKVGRDPSNDIALTGDRSMSRFHFQISLEKEEYYIQDCGSRNGTFLNGSPLNGSRKLQNDDVISIGVSRYRFSLNDSSHEQNGDASDTGSQSGAPRILMKAREAIQMLRGAVEDPALKPSSAEDQKDTIKTPVVNAHNRSASVKNGEAPFKSSGKFAKSAPAWLESYAFPELQRLLNERDRLNGLLEEVKQDIKQIDLKIVASQGVFQSLLSGSGIDLSYAVRQVFELMHWSCEQAPQNPFELSLKIDQKTESVLRIVVSSSDAPGHKDLEDLIKQQALIWCRCSYEPKAIMILQRCPHIPPDKRGPISATFLENMRVRKICVIEPQQLLLIYRELALLGRDGSEIKELILNTNGNLQGFSISAREDQSARA